MPVWKCWPQTLQWSWPTPSFLSSLTVMAFSWLQKRQVKAVARGSRCETDGQTAVYEPHGVVGVKESGGGRPEDRKTIVYGRHVPS
jgi:hypothetical protein